jgi:hypothetical protein
MQSEVGPAYKTGNLAETDGEPGAVENRLSLSTSEGPLAEKIKSWKDGQRYSLSDLGPADLVQISPGEFEVVPAEAETPAEDAATGEEPEMPMKRGGYNNPAIEGLLDSEKR